MRLLGVDFGGARIGLATYETKFGVGRALPFLVATGTLAKDAVAI
jgi:RNase H-fold protein (predicted Holliday junction resolvase)